jgi:two-component system sensor histidine kinase KdpD
MTIDQITGRRIASKFFNRGIFQYAVVISVIAATVILCKLFFNQKGYYIVSFILLFEVSLMAIFLRIIPILLASTISALVWNYFFIPPHFAFHIERTEDKLMFGSFFFFALINGVLTNRIRRQETLALEREERTNAIFQLTRDLSDCSGLNEIFKVALKDLRTYFKSDSIWIINEKKTGMEVISPEKIYEPVMGIDLSHASWVLKNSAKAGKYTDQFPDSGFTYYPLPGKRLTHGVVALIQQEPFSADEETFWTGFLTQISNALEREFLNELAHKARLLSESDKLYKTLFTLISHEFRIPIATIMGASDTLLMSDTTDENRTALSGEIFKASSRLNHLVENLLNMSRLESGKISVNPDWCDLNDLLNDTIRILSNELKEHTLHSSIPGDMPLVKLDYGLMEQVIYNLILNSCQYTPPGSVIKFSAGYNEGFLKIILEDNGPGFTPEQIRLVFNKFFRGDSNRPGGLGLGLSIVKGLIEAHKGTVIVENDTGGGVRFILSIPSEIPDLKKIKAE